MCRLAKTLVLYVYLFGVLEVKLPVRRTGGVLNLTPVNPVFAGIEQLLLLVFVIMTLVAIAGGNPGSVVAPVLQVSSRLIVGLLGLIFAALTAILKALVNMLPVLLKAISAGTTSAASRRIVTGDIKPLDNWNLQVVHSWSRDAH